MESYTSIHKSIKIIPRTLHTQDLAESKGRAEKNHPFAHKHVNLCIVMHARDPILLSSLSHIVAKIRVKFQLDRIINF